MGATLRHYTCLNKHGVQPYVTILVEQAWVQPYGTILVEQACVQPYGTVGV